MSQGIKEGFRRKRLPPFPGIAAVFGPGLIWAGLSQGSGELIWWPYMVAKYGAVFLGWLFIFAFLQYWYNQEIGRYTVATGEGILTGIYRVNIAAGWIAFIMIVMVYSWVGGYAGASASALHGITGFPPGWDAPSAQRLWSVIIILASFILIVLGPVAYKVIEVVESFAALASFIGMLAVALISPDVAKYAPEFFAGFTQFQWPPFEGWDPADEATWITLIAYTGAGGVWNLAYSYWIREKGFGQARHVGRVTSPLTGRAEPIPEVGYDFEPDEEAAREWRRWINWLWTDNLIGVLLNAFTIIITSLLTFSILRPRGLEISKDFNLVLTQGEWFASLWGEAGRIAMLLLGFFFLFDVFIVAGDLYSRFVSDLSYTVLRGSKGVFTRLIAIVALPVLILSIAADLATGTPLEAIATPTYLTSVGVVIVYLIAILWIIDRSVSTGWEYQRIYYSVWIVFTLMAIAQVFLKSPGGLIILTGLVNGIGMAFLMTVLIILTWSILPRIHGAGRLVRQHPVHLVIEILIAIAFWLVAAWFIAKRLGII